MASSVWIFGYGSLIWRPNFEYARSCRGYIKGWRRVWWQGSTDHRGTPERPGRTVTLHQDDSAVTWGVAYELAGCPETQRRTLEYLEEREKQYDIRHYVDIYASPSSSSSLSSLSDIDGEGGGPLGQDGMTDEERTANGTGTSDDDIQGGGKADPSSSSSLFMENEGAVLQALAAEQGSSPSLPDEVVAVRGCLVYIAGPDKSRNHNYLGPATLETIARQIAESRGPSGPNCEYLFRLAEASRQMGVIDHYLYELERLVREIKEVSGPS